ncbi:MAG: alpha/beta hydrolase fold domain-containing protein, partial [Acidimicrobiales bacterium]
MPLHPQVKALLDGLAQMGGPSMTEVSPAEARAMFKNLSALDQPEEVSRVDDRVVPGPVDVPIRVYTPAEAVGGDAPLLVWLHGGGWVIGDLDTADATARALANRSGAVVVSVDYRLAPEHPFPAAHDDALEAMLWVLRQV